MTCRWTAWPQGFCIILHASTGRVSQMIAILVEACKRAQVSLEPDQQFVLAKVAYLGAAFASALAKGGVAG